MSKDQASLKAQIDTLTYISTQVDLNVKFGSSDCQIILQKF